jgi:hypothetical protein
MPCGRGVEATPKISNYMYFVCYIVVNNINGMFYIGIHKTKYVHDEYLGSGVRILRAIEKYGKENFTKYIVAISDDRNKICDFERIMLKLTFPLKDKRYNLTDGGDGGWEFINANSIGGFSGRKHKTSSIEKMLETKLKNGNFYHTEESKRKIGIASRKNQNYKWASQANKGKKKSDEHKRKIADSLKKFHAP